MTTSLANPPKLQFFDLNGAPLVGGKLYTYAAGTTTPQVSYTDYGGGTPNANPVILDSRGEASVWLGTSLYKMALYDSTNVLIWTVDNIGGFATLAQLAASGGSNLIGFLQAGTGAVATTVQAKLRESVSVLDFIPAGTTTATTDCSTYINAALTAAAGKVLEFGSGETYQCDSPLIIKGNGTKILGRNSTIDSYAAVSALTCELTGGTTYLVNIDIEDFAIISRGVGAYAFRVLTSYSTYRRVSIALPVVNANGRGFFLPGDETYGTGPYYNTFIDCDVQSSSAGADHIGVSFSAIAPAYRTPNANTWIGGRVGQCLKNFVIKGNGNSFTNPASENAALTGTAFLFEADSATNCQQNYIHSCYIENANKGIEFTSSAKDNYVFGTFMTGVTTAITDAGTGNSVISALAAWKMPMGASFPTLSADPTALDYYGESTWTPVPTSVTVNSGTPVWTGTYTRVGNLVTAHIKMIGGNITVTSGASYVTLPFSASQVEWGNFGNFSTTVYGGSCASYSATLYFAATITTSSLTASITFRV